jgi:DNA-binding NtrC family response regulator
MSYRIAKAQWERKYWSRLFVRREGNVMAMARDAGVDRSTVYSALRAVGIIVAPPKRGRHGHPNWRPLLVEALRSQVEP